MSCEKHKKLIEKYLDGIINDMELANLKSHTESCPSCKNELEQSKQLLGAIAEGMSAEKTAEEARETILSELTTKRFESVPKVLFAGRMAVAASILIVAGLLLGFYLGRVTNTQTEAALTAKTPLRIANLEGIVLVKHQGAALWEKLEPESSVYIGDTFHSTSKSDFNLEFRDKSTIKLNQNSMLVLKEYNGGTQFHLEHGELAAALESPHPPFVVSTPNGRVEALGTEFTVSVE